MRDGWTSARFGDICDFEKSQDNHVGLPYVGLEDIESDTGNFLGSLAPTQVKSTTFGFTPAHVLYGRLRPYLNKVLLPDFSGHCSTEIFPIKPKENVDRKFIFYWLTSGNTVKAIDATSTGARMPRANMNAVLEFDVPLPSLADQRRIVAILDDAFDAIATAKANAEKNLRNAREVFASHLAQVFESDWPEVRIEDACASVMDCVNKTAPTIDMATPFMMIRTTNVRNGTISLNTVKYVSEETYRTWTRRQTPRRGDVILTREAPMGEVGMLLGDESVFLGQRLVSYRAAPEKLDARFLLFALQSPYLQKQIHARASGSTVQHMRVPDTKNLRLPLPGLDAQRGAIEKLDAIRESSGILTEAYARKLAALDELKQSLLHQAFSGAL